MAEYTTWASLNDRTYDARYLAPARHGATLPDVNRVLELFKREHDETIECPKSTLLFPYFAQWFTDGFLRSDRSEPRDPRRNESNHEIDLSQLYGLNATQTQALRSLRGGRLKSQIINGEEYPPHLCQQGRVKHEFESLRVIRFAKLSDAQKDRLFAMGSDTSNFQLGFVLLNVLFLREHNRIAGLLESRYTKWDDSRLFETSRNILVALLIKIVIGEYINHITPYRFNFSMDPLAFGRCNTWYRTNWMTIKFNLLYRWHSSVPSYIGVDQSTLTIPHTLWPGDLVTRRGLGAHFDRGHRANRLGESAYSIQTQNCTKPSGRASFRPGKLNWLATTTTVLTAASLGSPNFNQISGDRKVQDTLRDIYGHVDRIEFYVGLFAEDVRANSVLPPMMGRMVGVDRLFSGSD